MTSAAGVRYGVGMLRLSLFQQCAVRRLPSRKFSSTLQFQTNIQYWRLGGPILETAGERAAPYYNPTLLLSMILSSRLIVLD